MTHQIHRITAFDVTGPAQLLLVFEDGVRRSIDLASIVGRGFYEPLRDPAYFARVELDEELGTLVWPNGADFDPAQLHDWPRYGPELARLVATWPRG